MRANNLVFSLPNIGCDKNCPYCISKITGELCADATQIKRNLKKIKRTADMANVNNVLITGKGEPTMHMGCANSVLYDIADEFQDFPLEIQTNGMSLVNNFDKMVKEFRATYIDVVAVSVDNDPQIRKYGDMFDELRRHGFVVRMTVNITTLLKDFCNFGVLIDYCVKHNINQLSVRRVLCPEKHLEDDHKNVRWIAENAPKERYFQIYGDAKRLIHQYPNLYRQIAETADGTKVYDINGISFALIEYCIQETSKFEEIRSLIVQEDGHVYTSWDSLASVIF